MARDLAAREAKCEVLPVADYLLTGTEQAWSSGLDLMTTFYNAKAKRVERHYFGGFGQGISMALAVTTNLWLMATMWR